MSKEVAGENDRVNEVEMPIYIVYIMVNALCHRNSFAFGFASNVREIQELIENGNIGNCTKCERKLS